jgi:hypothetical protein
MQGNVSRGRLHWPGQKIFTACSNSFAVFCLLIRLVSKAPYFSTSAMVKELHMNILNQPGRGRAAPGLASVQGGCAMAASATFSEAEVRV